MASLEAVAVCLQQVLPVLLLVPPMLAGVFHAAAVAFHLLVAARAAAVVCHLWVVAVFRLWVVGVYHLWVVAVYHHHFSRSVRK